LRLPASPRVPARNVTFQPRQPDSGKLYLRARRRPAIPAFMSAMDLFEVLVLAVVQGIAEFLPISSSGHVVVVAQVFEQFGHAMSQMLALNIVLHVGTLGAILVFYWRRLFELLGQDRRVIGLLAVGTLPAAVVGLTVRWLVGESLQMPLLVGCMFPLTGAILLSTARLKTGTMACRQLSYTGALLIGVSQAVAILPGISRSGATIMAGLACGLKREEAATFSFLLAIPAIGGAGLLELACLLRAPSDSISLGFLGLGAVLSFAVGLASLAWLLRWLQKGYLHHFAWWVLLLGPAVIAWTLLRQ